MLWKDFRGQQQKRYRALWLLQPLAVKRKALFKGKKAFWLSVGFKLNWNLMCGMWNSGSLARSQESTECEVFFSPPPLSLSLFPSFSPLPLFFSLHAGVSYISPVSHCEGDWRIERREGLELWHPAVLTLTGITYNHLWTNGLKG